MHIDKYKCNDPEGYEVEGVFYSNPEHFIVIHLLKLCGCGNPKDTLKFIAKVLTALKEDFNIRFDCVMNICGNENSAEYILHTLDRNEIIEHGTSIFGAWLTQKGEQLLQDINELYKEP